jgi:hypothetical protein
MSLKYIPLDKIQALDNLIINNKKTSYWINDIEIRSLKKLLDKQYEICSDVLNELEINKSKTSHWAWYIFPNQFIGQNDKLETYLSQETAQILLEVAPKEWQLCLEKIIELTEKNNNKLLTVLPKIDILRVNEFIKFWDNIPRPGSFLRWFTIVLYKLKLFIIEDDDIQEYLHEKSNEAEIEAILQNGPNNREQTIVEKELRKQESEEVKKRQKKTFKSQLEKQKVERNKIVPLLKKELQIQITAKKQDDKIDEGVKQTHLQRQIQAHTQQAQIQQAQTQIQAQIQAHTQQAQIQQAQAQTQIQAQIQAHTQQAQKHAQIQAQIQQAQIQQAQIQQAQIQQTQIQQAQIQQAQKHAQIQAQIQQAQTTMMTPDTLYGYVQSERERVRIQHQITQIQQLIKNIEIQRYQYLIELKQVLAKKQ